MVRLPVDKYKRPAKRGECEDYAQQRLPEDAGGPAPMKPDVGIKR